MRIEREDGTPVGPAWAVLTVDDARFLLDALTLFFDDYEDDPQGSHWHIGNGENELTVAIEDVP